MAVQPNPNPAISPSFVAPPSNIAGSANQIGTVTFLDAAGNQIKVERIVVNSPNGDVVAYVDPSGGLSVNVQQDAAGMSEMTQCRRLLEALLLEMQSFNANFLSANPGITTGGAQDSSAIQ